MPYRSTALPSTCHTYVILDCDRHLPVHIQGCSSVECSKLLLLACGTSGFRCCCVNRHSHAILSRRPRCAPYDGYIESTEQLRHLRFSSTNLCRSKHQPCVCLCDTRPGSADRALLQLLTEVKSVSYLLALAAPKAKTPTQPSVVLMFCSAKERE
uniref:Uncharacterized protein n=1 Tax=Haptolina ericina TaxID=156174 RepID=A0A7S3F1T6_9EUKA